MIRLLVLLAVCLGLFGASALTCQDDPNKSQFLIEEKCWDLEADGAVYGGLCMDNVARKGLPTEPGALTNCFRITYRVAGNNGLLKLRAGLWKTGDVIPKNKDRFTRRRRIAGINDPKIQLAKIDICPTDIEVEQLSCCGESMDFVAFAEISVPNPAVTPGPSSEPVSSGSPSVKKVWLTPHFSLEDCRLRLPNRDDQLICSTLLNCPPCTPESCLMGTGCVPLDTELLGCGFNNV
ncbi:hypothetical protein NDN08_004909 [Rhodosorus marinus]|uniref:Secreted protein n=1 Tax=Rhodosorus marinus TaxID=101924 RepID=A0AAV8UHP8_9RHOD|nr:hypothetical protein NDN08_004909 [Rhodosorus marinus]